MTGSRTAHDYSLNKLGTVTQQLRSLAARLQGRAPPQNFGYRREGVESKVGLPETAMPVTRASVGEYWPNSGSAINGPTEERRASCWTRWSRSVVFIARRRFGC